MSSDYADPHSRGDTTLAVTCVCRNVSNGQIGLSGGLAGCSTDMRQPLNSRSHTKDSRLAAGNLDLRSIPQLDVQPPALPKLDADDEIEIYDLSAIGAKEPSWIQFSLEGSQGAAQ